MAKSQFVEIHQLSPSTSEARIRNHSVMIDRPADKGGEDRGPFGGEYLSVALGGCFMSNLLAAIRSREAPVSRVRVRVTATLDGTPERFTEFRVRVAAETSDPELFQKLVTISERACAVSNTLRDSAKLSFAIESL